MTRGILAVLLLFQGAAAAAPEPDQHRACAEAVAEARARAGRLPPGDVSRRFAEVDLNDALIEMDAGEVDECPELVDRALRTIEERPYRLRPGEVMHGYGPAS